MIASSVIDHSRIRRRAFSLVEMVMVVAILGIVAAIAAPRMTTAARSATANALTANLASVRKAIDMYYAEHGRYPGYDPSTGLPDGTFFVKQLTMFTDLSGRPSATFSAATYRYGPYLRGPFPKNPTNHLDTVHVKATPSDPNPADGSVGWIAVLSHGYFGISATNSGLDSIGIVKPGAKNDVRAAEQVGGSVLATG